MCICFVRREQAIGADPEVERSQHDLVEKLAHIQPHHADKETFASLLLCIYIKEEVNTALPGTPLFNDTRRFVQNSGHIVCYCLKDRLKGQNNLNF